MGARLGAARAGLAGRIEGNEPLDAEAFDLEQLGLFQDGDWPEFPAQTARLATRGCSSRSARRPGTRPLAADQRRYASVWPLTPRRRPTTGRHRNYVGACERGEISLSFGSLLRLVSVLEEPVSRLSGATESFLGDRIYSFYPRCSGGRPALRCLTRSVSP